MMKMRDMPRLEAFKLWVGCFSGLLVPFVLLKAGLVGYYATGGRSFEPLYKLLPKSLMYFGGEILGAALLAGLTVLLCLPLLLLRRFRLAGLLAVGLLALVAVVAAASTASMAYMGGPLTLQAFQTVLISDDPAGVSDAAMLSSLTDMLNVFTVAALVLSPLLALWGFSFLGPRMPRGRRGVILASLLAAEALLTVVFVPRMVSGEIGLRIYSDGLEQSPSTAFLESLALPLMERLGKNVVLEDPFVMDIAAKHEQRPAGEAPPLSGATPGKTNVVYVMLESVGETYQEETPALMPFLKSLGTGPGGAWFKRHYSTYSLTTGAWFSMFCSEQPYPSFKPITRLFPAIPCRCLSETLADEGYRTILASSHPFAWDQRTRFLKHRRFEVSFDPFSNPRRPESFTTKWGIDDAATVDEALSYLEKGDGRPFFLFLMLISGHHPFIASREQEEHPAPDRLTEYTRALAHGDLQLRRFVEGLERLGLAESTMIVVVSDHGESHGQQAGRNVLEPVVRVPWVIRAPQLSGATVTSNLVTSHLDIPPTIMGLLGLPIPCTMKGRNLLADAAPELAFFGGRPPKAQLGLVDGPWKFVLEDRHRTYLYDISSDPEQRLDLASQRPDLVAEFETRLRYFIAHTENLISNYPAILKKSRCGR